MENSHSLRILLTAYECAPFYKRGGLGDVMGALPKALREVGVDARVVIPYYNMIREANGQKRVGEYEVEFEGKKRKIGVYEGFYGEQHVPIYFLENHAYLVTDNVRGKNKRIEQFAFFNLAVVELVSWLSKNKDWKADLLHCNDWHTALIPLIIDQKQLNLPTLLTIHNLNYQGKGSVRLLDLLGIEDQEAMELKRGVPATELNVLGEGILHATTVSTVSPTYAREISSENNRRPIYDYLRRRKQERSPNGKVLGILNGVDYDVWSPGVDHYIKTQFDATNWEQGKKANKQDLLLELGLEERLLFCFVGRMVGQKGVDLLMSAVPTLVNLNANLIVLGSGNPAVEQSTVRVAQQHKDNIRVALAYDEKFAHKLYASSDFIVIPSRFEPCGLIQMISMKYGTIPIASNTGGLSDSIADGRNGFLFKTGSKHDLKQALRKASKRYAIKAEYNRMVEDAMQTDFSWKQSVLEYKRLYQEIMGKQLQKIRLESNIL